MPIYEIIITAPVQLQKTVRVRIEAATEASAIDQLPNHLAESDTDYSDEVYIDDSTVTIIPTT